MGAVPARREPLLAAPGGPVVERPSGLGASRSALAGPAAGAAAAPDGSAAPAPAEQPVEVRRSARRQRTVTAFRESGGLVVCIPAEFTREEEDDWVARMVLRVRAQEQRRHLDDDDLVRRARDLSERHLDGLARPSGVRWVDNQTTRWGSTSPEEGSIRLSSRLRGMPAWVVDYVLVHELAHLLERGHTDRFWSLVGRYPRTERARGYLEGVAAVQHRPPDEDCEA